MEHSVCNFIGKTERTDEINIFNFVYEKEPRKNRDYFGKTHYKLLICTGGEATVSYEGKNISLTVGDVLFTFPDSVVSLIEEDDFNFIYITFDGIVAGNTLKDIGVSKDNNVFYGYGECLPTCESCIALSTPESSYFLAKSAMLFLFACIKNRTAQTGAVREKELIANIKNYIANNYSDPALSVDSIAKYFSYNKNYISTLFKKETGVSIVRYMNDVRINTACALAGSISSVKDIAFMCGFGDPLYFTRLFKRATGIAPKEYIKLKSQGRTSEEKKPPR